MTLGKPGEPQRQSSAITWSLLRGRLGRHTDKERQLEEEQGRFEDAGLRMRVTQLKQRRPTAPHPRSWKKQESFSSEASGGSTALPTLGFQPIDTDVGCQASRIIRIHICCLKPTSLWSFVITAMETSRLFSGPSHWMHLLPRMAFHQASALLAPTSSVFTQIFIISGRQSAPYSKSI